jgi:hypothetical protein
MGMRHSRRDHSRCPRDEEILKCNHRNGQAHDVSVRSRDPFQAPLTFDHRGTDRALAFGSERYVVAPTCGVAATGGLEALPECNAIRRLWTGAVKKRAARYLPHMESAPCGADKTSNPST